MCCRAGSSRAQPCRSSSGYNPVRTLVAAAFHESPCVLDEFAVAVLVEPERFHVAGGGGPTGSSRPQRPPRRDCSLGHEGRVRMSRILEEDGSQDSLPP